MNTRFLQPISDSGEITKIRKCLGRVVRPSLEEQALVDIFLIKHAGWVAVPTENYTQAIWLNEEKLQVFLARGYQHLLAVAMDPMENYSSLYAVPTTIEGIEELNRYWGFFNYALFAGEPDWAVISTDREYDVIVGPPNFVSQLLDCELEEAFSRFHAYVVDHPAMREGAQHLYSLKHLLQNEYPRAEIAATLPLWGSSPTETAEAIDDTQLIGQAVLKLTTADYQGAIRDCTAYLQADPNEASAYYLRGDAYYALGNQKAALEDYQKALEIYGDQEESAYLQDIQEKLQNLKQ